MNWSKIRWKFVRQDELDTLWYIALQYFGSFDISIKYTYYNIQNLLSDLFPDALLIPLSVMDATSTFQINLRLIKRWMWKPKQLHSGIRETTFKILYVHSQDISKTISPMSNMKIWIREWITNHNQSSCNNSRMENYYLSSKQ